MQAGGHSICHDTRRAGTHALAARGERAVCGCGGVVAGVKGPCGYLVIRNTQVHRSLHSLAMITQGSEIPRLQHGLDDPRSCCGCCCCLCLYPACLLHPQVRHPQTCRLLHKSHNDPDYAVFIVSRHASPIESDSVGHARGVPPVIGRRSFKGAYLQGKARCSRAHPCFPSRASCRMTPALTCTLQSDWSLSTTEQKASCGRNDLEHVMSWTANLVSNLFVVDG
jgi:hypothetical protein